MVHRRRQWLKIADQCETGPLGRKREEEELDAEKKFCGRI